MIKRPLAVILAAVALLALGAPAQGQQYPPNNNTIIISDTIISGGQIVIIQGSTFGPGSTITINFLSGAQTLVADENGGFELQAVVPTGVAPGEYDVVASGTGADGTPLEVSSSVNVVDAALPVAPGAPAAPEAPAAAAPDAGVAAPGAGAAPVALAQAADSDTLPRTGNEAAPLARIAVALLAVGGGLMYITRRRRAVSAVS